MSAGPSGTPVPHEMRHAAAALCKLLAEISTVDMRSFESRRSIELATVLRPMVQEWLSAALGIVDTVTAACKRQGEDPFRDAPNLTFELRLDSLMVAGSAARSLVADVAFVARLELAQRLKQVSCLMPEAGEAEILTQCDSALRRITKSLGALENAIACVEGVTPRTEYRSELAVSLRVRATYAKLRAAIQAGGEVTPQTLVKRLRGAGTQIAKLIGSDVYPELRIRDRFQIRNVQARILDWLRTPEPRDELAGMRLWQDLDSFVRMLALVNKRQELVAHDASLVVEIATRLTCSGADPSILATAGDLRGLDEELDTMLDNSSAVERSYWLDVLTRLQMQFGRASGPEWI